MDFAETKKSLKIRPLAKLLLASIILSFFTACAPDTYTPALDTKGRRYNADNLAKDWRDQYNKRHHYPQYPADNDEEYYYPKYPVPNHRTPPTRYTPPPGYPQYPQDNDASYGTRYPKYDPEADNDSYYYINKNKKLPKVKSTGDEYNYPIYFD